MGDVVVLARIAPVKREHAHADARRQLDVVREDARGLADQLDHLRRDASGVVRLGHVPEQDHELVAAQPRDRVLGAHRGGQPAGEGLEKLAKMECPCLIILDLFMPVMDGNEFLRELHARNGVQPNKVFSIPIALLSAAPPLSQAVESAKPLVTTFIKKPVDLDGFLDTVKQYCAEGEKAA